MFEPLPWFFIKIINGVENEKNIFRDFVQKPTLKTPSFMQK